MQVNVTPTASQKLHEVVPISFSWVCSIDCTVWVQPHSKTHAMEGQINVFMAKIIGRTEVEPEK